MQWHSGCFQHPQGANTASYIDASRGAALGHGGGGRRGIGPAQPPEGAGGGGGGGGGHMGQKRRRNS